MRDSNQLDYRVCHLTAHEFDRGFPPPFSSSSRKCRCEQQTTRLPLDLSDLHTVPGTSRSPARNSRNV
jgi:hypothetical protein